METKTKLKTVSKWLSELGTHTIYDNDRIKGNFREETGKEPCWGDGISHKQMRSRIEARGKGGELAEDKGQRFIGSIDIAYSCYQKYADGKGAMDKFGMGSQFFEYVSAIKNAGH